VHTIRRFLVEIWRRRVLQIGAVYVGLAAALFEGAAQVSQTLHLPEWVAQAALLFLSLGLPVVLFITWIRGLALRDDRHVVPQSTAVAEVHHVPAIVLPPHDVSSICVLPFANVSDDAQQEYFSDGITDDIITDLSKVSALFVVARNTSFAFKGNSDALKIAQQLGVSHILAGSVRKAAGEVRITAQLIDGVTGGQLWADRYDRALSDIFALQDEISEAIVRALKLRLLPEEREAIERLRTSSVEAYNLYLMARREYVDGSDGDPKRDERIIRLCTRATEIDPAYARAWALMAVGQVASRLYRGGSGDGGLAAAERALTLDAMSSEAHAVKARVLSEADHQSEASREIALALKLDPESWEANKSAGLIRFKQKKIDDAIFYWEKAVALEEKDFASAGMLITCYTAKADQKSARRVASMTLARCEEVLALERNNGHAMGYGTIALASLGQAERAKEWMSRALLIDPDNIAMRYNFACTLAVQLKDSDASLEMLRPVFSKMAIGFLNHAKVDPDLASLKNDPRYKLMLAKAEARLENSL
jgi:adenylate cyclase